MQVRRYKYKGWYYNRLNTRHWLRWGKFYGYPLCCIEDFRSLKPSTDDQLKVNERKGFIPCHSCALKVLEGKETVASLIKNRICKIPY